MFILRIGCLFGFILVFGYFCSFSFYRVLLTFHSLYRPKTVYPNIHMDPHRIFIPEQIQVHSDLPSILKNYTKAVIKANPADIYQFSFDYFQQVLAERG